jgi:translocation and assembly module TamB
MRYRSVLGAFTFFVLASFVAFVFFIQSDNFGRVFSKVVSDLAQRKAETKIRFKSVKINLFPPGLFLERVKIKKKLDPETTLMAEFGELGLSLALFQIEDRSFNLGELRIKDSVIEILQPVKNEPVNEIPQEKVDHVFDVIKKSPLWLNAILVENMKFITTHEWVDAKRIKITKAREKIKLRLHASSLKPDKDKDFIIDEIWADATVDKKLIKIQRIKVQHDVQSLLIKGEINNYSKLLASEGSLNGEGQIYLNSLNEMGEFSEKIKFNQGVGHISFRGSFKNKNIEAKSDMFFQDLKSTIIDADEIIASAEFRDNKIRINKMNLLNQDQSLRLVNSGEVYDFKKNQLLESQFDVEVSKIELRNILKFLPALTVLNSKLTGNAQLKLTPRGIKIHLADKFILNDFVFEVGDDSPFRILGIQSAKLSNTELSFENHQFNMTSSIQLKNSNLNFAGKINESSVEFITKDSIINFEDFGNISNLDIKGRGPLDIKVHGPLDDVVIDLKGQTENFEVLGYHLGKSREDISIILSDSVVNINSLESIYRSTPISGTGSINYKNSDITLGIDSPNATFADLKEILKPIFSKLDFLPQDLDFTSRIDAQVFGKTSIPDLKISSDVNFKDLNAYGENVNLGSMKIKMKNQIFEIQDMVAQSGRGQLNGDFLFNLKNNKINFNLDWDELSLQKLRFIKKTHLNLDGLLFGSLKGHGQLPNYEAILENKLTRTNNQDYQYPDSDFNVSFSPNSIKGDFSIFKDNIITSFKYSKLKSIPSELKTSINLQDIKPFSVAVFGDHLKGEDFNGSIIAIINTTFREDFNDVNFNGFIKKLSLSHEQFNVNYLASEPQFLIENDVVKKWNLQIDSPDLNIKSKGRGKFGQEVLLSNYIQMNAKLLEIFLKPVMSAQGMLGLSLIIDGKNSNYDVLAKSSSHNLSLTLEHVPVPLNDINYEIEYFKKKLLVKKLKASIESGYAALNGEIYFDDMQPDINLKYIIDKAEIPFMGKSFVNITGQGMLIGDSMPYGLTGEIFLNKCQVLNELTDFTSKSPVTVQSRFLPRGYESTLSKFLNMNLRLKTENPIRIANSLMDVNLKGEVTLDGSVDRMRGQGRLTSGAGQSKIFFKNNEYLINQADINFDPKKDIKNPDFDIHALTTISNYKINAKAYGNLERFNFDLTSDPSLPRNSILSLIAFGYSDEIRSSLTQSQQQNLTQVGVGSFVFDRFKISDILNKQFGLQVNLGTVFEQSQTTSLLTGRNQDGQGTLGRTRTATKIELKKRLDDALNLSVSSTMGGSIGQRQSMNLNYSLSKKVQLEGVYELRTNAEGEEDIIDNSVGGDLKFRWTFK